LDNVTHSLIGVVIADSIVHRPGVQKRITEIKGLKTAIYMTAIFGSNLPDADLITRFFRKDAAFSYLLDHRGWTHTVVAIPILAFICLAFGAIFASFRLLTRRERWGMLGVGAVGLCFHIFADSWNEYGVHPFAPFYNRWFYGDFIFIVEPWLWAAVLPLLLVKERTRPVKVIAILGYVVMLALMIKTAVIPVSLIIGYFVLAAFLGFMIFRTAGSRRWIASVMGIVAALGIFHSSSYLARGKVEQGFASQRPFEKIVQLASSPMPTNPLCWRFVVASRDKESDDYLARAGTVSLAPERFPAAECQTLMAPRGLVSDGIAPTSEIRFFNSPALVWAKEFRGSIAEMRKLWRENCGFQSLLRFARIPFWINPSQSVPAEGLVAGDLRYDRGGGRASFATHTVNDSMGRAADGSCSQWIWTSPVESLLNE